TMRVSLMRQRRCRYQAGTSPQSRPCMAKIFITGSSDGLGRMAAELLLEQGHQVVLHARSAARAEETRRAVAGAEAVVVGDLQSMAETKAVAEPGHRLARLPG